MNKKEGGIELETATTNKAPAAIGPYSQAVIQGGFVFTSGQIPIDPATGALRGSDIASQAEQVMKNLAAVLEAAGSSLSSAVKTTCFLKNMDDFAKFNEVYGAYFPQKPARSCVEVSCLPKGALVEVEVIAAVE